MQQRLAAPLVWLALGCGCTQADDRRPKLPPPPLASGAENAGAPADTPVSAGSVAPGNAFVAQVVALRRAPHEGRFLEANKKKGQPNVMTVLHRGEGLVVLQVQKDWLQVQISDEQTGWVKAQAVVVGTGLRPATTLSRLPCFTRPDLLALAGTQVVEPGTLLFVVRQKEAFSEVDVGGRNNVWVLSDALEEAPAEVQAAKIYQRARPLLARQDEAAQPLVALLRSRFGRTRLVHVLLPEPEPQPSAASVPGAVDAAAAPATAQDAAAPVEQKGSDDGRDARDPDSLDALSEPLAPPPSWAPQEDVPQPVVPVPASPTEPQVPPVTLSPSGG